MEDTRHLDLRTTDRCWGVQDVVEAPTPCSRCGAMIPAEELPLLVWNAEGGMWLYHFRCVGL